MNDTWDEWFLNKEFIFFEYLFEVISLNNYCLNLLGGVLLYLEKKTAGFLGDLRIFFSSFFITGLFGLFIGDKIVLLDF